MSDAPAFDHVVVHWGEIGTKGGNRASFEARLALNLRNLLAPVADVKVRREASRLRFELGALPAERRDELLALVALQPGVSWLAPAIRTEPTLEAMSAAVVRLAQRGTGSFRITAKRSDRRLPFDTLAIHRALGDAVVLATGRRVDLHAADDDYCVEVSSHAGYVLAPRIAGPDGLPVGTAGRVVCLLSGGIDSPVAAWRMMVRGCDVTGVHLWNRSFSGEGVREKALDLARALARHQGRFRMILVPFDAIQREIVAVAPADLRMLLYRRAMLRVADEVRRAIGGGAIVTGDSVSQVASQTLPNLAATYAAVPPPVLTPLAGSLKSETVAAAQRIGTYAISIRPGDDCCGLLVARHPRTSSTAEELADIERGYDLAALLADAAKERETHDFRALGGS